MSPQGLSYLMPLIDEAIWFYRVSFYLWNTIFIALGIVMIVIPIVVGTFHTELTERRVKLLMVISAICVAVNNWTGLSTVGANFERAYMKLEIAKADYELQKDKDGDKLLDAYKGAKQLVLYVLAAPSTADEPASKPKPAPEDPNPKSK